VALWGDITGNPVDTNLAMSKGSFSLGLLACLECLGFFNDAKSLGHFDPIVESNSRQEGTLRYNHWGLEYIRSTEVLLIILEARVGRKNLDFSKFKNTPEIDIKRTILQILRNLVGFPKDVETYCRLPMKKETSFT
jgi:hypothetical protein